MSETNGITASGVAPIAVHQHEQRSAPVVIPVCPPRKSPIPHPIKWVLGSIGVVVVLVLVLTVPAAPAAVSRAVTVWSVAALALGGLIAWAANRSAQFAARDYDAFIERYPDWAKNPLGEELAVRWKKRGALLPKAVVDTLRAELADDSRPPCIVVLGNIELVPPGDYRFEPIVVTPTRFIGKRLYLLIAPGAVLAYWAAILLHVIPNQMSLYLGSFGYVFVSGIAVAIVWIRRAVWRPTYLRLAPGIIQVVTYRGGRQRPEIRDYPIDNGTLVVLQQTSGRAGVLAAHLARGEHADEIPLWQMPRRAELAEQLLQVLASTAPIPPLSDEYLVG